MWLEVDDEIFNLDKIRYITKSDYSVNGGSMEYVIYLDEYQISYDNEKDRDNDFYNISIALKINKNYLKI